MHQEAGELCCSFHRCSRRWWDALDRAADRTATTCLSAENRADRRLCEQSQTIAVSGVAAQYKEGQIGTEKVRYGMVLFSCHMKVSFLYNLELLEKNIGYIINSCLCQICAVFKVTVQIQTQHLDPVPTF
jgi:hypothetical protein